MSFIGKIISFLLGLVILAAVLLVLRQGISGWRLRDSQEQPKAAVPRVVINNANWVVDVADNSWARAQGLSGREFLASNEGMLFLFDEADNHKFWMRGMKFPLDFVWIRLTGQNRGVAVGVTENAPPLTLNNIAYYYPPEPIDAVLEINAGSVAKYNIKAGDAVYINF